MAGQHPSLLTAAEEPEVVVVNEPLRVTFVLDARNQPTGVPLVGRRSGRGEEEVVNARQAHAPPHQGDRIALGFRCRADPQQRSPHGHQRDGPPVRCREQDGLGHCPWPTPHRRLWLERRSELEPRPDWISVARHRSWSTGDWIRSSTCRMSSVSQKLLQVLSRGIRRCSTPVTVSNAMTELVLPGVPSPGTHLTSYFSLTIQDWVTSRRTTPVLNDRTVRTKSSVVPVRTSTTSGSAVS